MVHFCLGVQGCYGDGVMVLRCGPGGTVYAGIIGMGLEIPIKMMLGDSPKGVHGGDVENSQVVFLVCDPG